MDYMSIIEDLAGEYGVFMNIALYVIEDMQKSTDDLRREFKTAKLPHMRFYPNEKTGEEKRNGSFEVILPKTDDIETIKEAVIEEI